MKEPFIKRIVFPENMKKGLKITQNEEFGKFTFHKTIATEIVDDYDEFLINFLFQEYAKTDATDLIVLNKTRFKDFLLKYLPIYIKELENE